MTDPVSFIYFKAIRGRHHGRRGFVIGNGPSLRIEDLTRLAKTVDITIASNKVYLAFDQTPWRPDYYSIVDILLWKKVRQDLHEHVPLVFTPLGFTLVDCRCEARRWNYLGLAGETGDDRVDFSDDVGRGIFGGCSVTYDNLQLAVHLGLNPIYLIGCDHFYHGEQAVQRDRPIPSPAAINHFLPNYREPGEVVNPAPLDLMERAYRHARRFADRNGISIFNATRGGQLEVFERTDFDSLFGEGGGA